MYKINRHGGVIKDGRFFIPENPDNRHWQEYLNWIAEGNTPEAADPEPVPEAPEPTVSELIDALEKRDAGDSIKWNEVRSRKKLERIK